MREKREYLREVLQRARDIHGVPAFAPFGDEKWYYTVQPISWIADGACSGEHRDVHVPIGFVTDLASIPDLSGR